MRLDFNPGKDCYVLYVPRNEADLSTIQREFGLSLSVPASTPETAVLFTYEAYQAASFSHVATERAQAALLDITTGIAASWAASCSRHIDLPPDKELWPFQRASASYCLDRLHALDGDQPGLGKTPTAIAINNEIQAAHTLVVCPASIRHQWREKIIEWDVEELDHRDVAVIVSSKRGIPWPLPKWTIISWELVHSPGLWRALAKAHFDHLILDEAHYAKHIDTKRARAVFGGGDNPIADPLISISEKVTALTGTPLPKRPQEAYVLARNLCFDAIEYMSQEDFNEKYNPIDQGIYSHVDGTIGFWKDEETFNEAELQNRMRANYMVRHMKRGHRGVMNQLNYPLFDLIHVQETDLVKQALAAEALLDIDWRHMEGLNAQALGHIAAARREMGVAMAPQVAEYVAMLLDGGETKLTLFAWHIEVLDILCRRLAKYGVIRVDGSDGAKRKYTKVQEFINDPSKQVIIGNVKSLGTGTDGLQHVSSHGLMAEADWTHGNNEQCADRLDRGGQNETVQFDIFVAPGSIAEKVLAAALRDAEVCDKALDRKVEDGVWLKTA
jgi:SWI/SNF-related matrix-associated actin-dependent regulator of chromatin subfamily A-like protein 1